MKVIYPRRRRNAQNNGRGRPRNQHVVHVPAALAEQLPERLRDKCLYLVGTVRRVQLERSCGPVDWVPLMSELLNKILGEAGRIEATKFLRGLGAVQVRHDYKIGVESKKYRLGPAFCDGPFVSVAITDEVILDNLEKAYDRHRKGIARDKLLKGMARSLARFTVKDDAPDDERLAALRRYGFGRNLKRRKTKGMRAYHALTNLARELRQHVLVDGEPVWVLDISCSQPLLFGLFLLAAHAPPRDVPSTIRAAMAKVRELDIDRDELLDYIADCQQGNTYDGVATATGLPRIFVKLGWMQTVFGVPLAVVAEQGGWPLDRDPVAVRVGRGFYDRYPSVYGCLPDLWRLFGRGGLPVLLQRFESWLFLDRLVPQLQEWYPDEPIATVHDALAVRGSFRKAGKAAIEDTYRELFGVVPRVKEEDWSKPQAAKQLYEEMLFEYAVGIRDSDKDMADDIMSFLARTMVKMASNKKYAGTTAHRYLKSKNASLLPYVPRDVQLPDVTLDAAISCGSDLDGQANITGSLNAATASGYDGFVVEPVRKPAEGVEGKPFCSKRTGRWVTGTRCESHPHRSSLYDPGLWVTPLDKAAEVLLGRRGAAGWEFRTAQSLREMTAGVTPERVLEAVAADPSVRTAVDVMRVLAA